MEAQSSTRSVRCGARRRIHRDGANAEKRRSGGANAAWSRQSRADLSVVVEVFLIGA